MKSHSMLFAIAAVWGVAFAGCQQEEGSRPATYPVSGVVTLNGEPVAGAAVSFVPQGDGGQGASAITDSSGRYELTTFASGDGALPGQYQVKVVKYEQAPTDTQVSAEPVAQSAIPGDEGYAEPEEDTADTAPAENLLPEMYADATRSGLTVTVTEGANTHDLKLVDE